MADGACMGGQGRPPLRRKVGGAWILRKAVLGTVFFYAKMKVTEGV